MAVLIHRRDLNLYLGNIFIRSSLNDSELCKHSCKAQICSYSIHEELVNYRFGVSVVLKSLHTFVGYWLDLLKSLPCCRFFPSPRVSLKTDSKKEKKANSHVCGECMKEWVCVSPASVCRAPIHVIKFWCSVYHETQMLEKVMWNNQDTKTSLLMVCLLDKARKAKCVACIPPYST